MKEEIKKLEKRIYWLEVVSVFVIMFIVLGFGVLVGMTL